ncbi:hypothetical protein [Streptomyces sp. NPDC101132]|uniref:hypothetical protein n=1 Tax=Streptomyces sp. NPDC101132 TaxID=3366110 RepID=UPI0038167078
MISEPEITSYDDPHASYPLPESGPAAPPEGTPAPRGRRLAWALTGAVTVSALWVAGLYVLHPPHEPAAERPRMDYALPSDMCDRVHVPALGQATRIADWSETGRTRTTDPALRTGVCWRDSDHAGARGQWRSWNVRASVELHHRTDPEPEFEARSAELQDSLETPRQEEVPGLGQRALMLTTSATDGRILRVLDGGGVFQLVVTTTANTDYSLENSPDAAELPEPDWTEVQSAMIEDARGMLAALRTP